MSRALEWLGKVLPSLEYLVLVTSAHVTKEGSLYYHRTKNQRLHFQIFSKHKNLINSMQYK